MLGKNEPGGGDEYECPYGEQGAENAHVWFTGHSVAFVGKEGNTMTDFKPFWLVLAAVGGVALLSLASIGGMVGGVMGPGMMWGAYDRGPNGWAWPVMMGAGWLMMVLFWLGIGAGVYLLVRATTGSRSQEAPDAMEVLRRRYAAGEIDEVTYERQREKLAA